MTLSLNDDTEHDVDKKEHDVDNTGLDVNVEEDGKKQEKTTCSWEGAVNVNDPAMERLFMPLKARHDPLWLGFKRFQNNKRRLLHLLKTPVGGS